MNCNKCAFQCKYCTGGTHYDCKECNPGFYMPNGTSICLTRCPDGEYANNVDFNYTCYFCDLGCSTCEGVSYNCTSCHTLQKYLLNNACLTSCPNGYSWNNNTYTCDMCDYLTYSFWGACLTICPDNYTGDNLNRSCVHLSEAEYYF